MAAASPCPTAVSRRSFTAAAAATLSATMVHSSLAAADTRELRIGVIGCGGRGGGAINDSLSINEGVKLVATADLYGSKGASLWKAMREAHPGKVASADTIHEGFDGYRRILDDPSIDLVHVTTSPGFRPAYTLAAVEAGKHVFTEKPACVDPAGYRICLTAHDAAVAKGTAIVAGTQYRRQVNYLGALEQIRNGAIGDVIGATARYCAGGIWYRPRTEGMSVADAYKQEHKDLVDSIRAGTPIVELRQMADSSLVAVMGRMAAYSGQKVSWKFASEESQLDLFPKDLTWTSSLPVQAPAVPGKTKLI